MSELVRFSFTAANSIPVKIFKNANLMESLLKGHVPPFHLQLNPTNRCNFNCVFCSCEKRDQTQELPFDDLLQFIDMSKSLGLSSITITGGGEPLCYANISELLTILHSLNVQVGLVCNGSLLKRLSKSDLDKLVWCRISCSDVLGEQTNIDAWFKTISETVERCGSVDWAFSYVVRKYPQYDLIRRLINFANCYKFTHVRLVSDLLDIDSAPNMKTVQWNLTRLGVDDSKVIYQGRKHFTHGAKTCYISLLKPVVGADGGIWPCCGTQYALANPSLDYEKTMRMGDWFSLPDLIKEQKFFDGSSCVRCYYDEYNQVLGAILGKTEHVRFV